MNCCQSLKWRCVSCQVVLSSSSSPCLLVHEPSISQCLKHMCFIFHVLYETVEKKMHLGQAQYLYLEGLILHLTAYLACTAQITPQCLVCIAYYLLIITVMFLSDFCLPHACLCQYPLALLSISKWIIGKPSTKGSFMWATYAWLLGFLESFCYFTNKPQLRDRRPHKQKLSHLLLQFHEDHRSMNEIMFRIPKMFRVSSRFI